MGPPQISVLLPYKDADETLEEAIASLLEQRGVTLEIIAVDDGSRDEGPARVARLAARHRGLVAVAAAGEGIARALTRGLAEARAPVIGRMDADDVSHPDRFRVELDALSADPRLGVVGCRVEAFPAEAIGPGLERYVAWQNTLLGPEEHRREIFIESPLCHPSVILRREALEAVGGWRDGPFPEDYDLWLRLDAAGFGLAKVPETLFRWRHRDGRATYTDPRYASERFPEVKAPPLARRLRALGRPFVVWGAGPTGKRLARALEAQGLRPEAFIDIDPRKIGRVARGAPIRPPDTVRRDVHTVLVAVGAPEARPLIRSELDRRGLIEGEDYLCAA